jgi:hypothetical protein
LVGRASATYLISASRRLTVEGAETIPERAGAAMVTDGASRPGPGARRPPGVAARAALVAGLLLLPSDARALGLWFAPGFGVRTEGAELKSAIEVAAFHDLRVLRLELPVELQIEPEPALALRPGVKAYVPVTGLYARLGVGLGDLGADRDDPSFSLVLGGGWELSLIDAFGVFLEVTGEPRLAPPGSVTFMGRAGAVVIF